MYFNKPSRITMLFPASLIFAVLIAKYFENKQRLEAIEQFQSNLMELGISWDYDPSTLLALFSSAVHYGSVIGASISLGMMICSRNIVESFEKELEKDPSQLRSVPTSGDMAIPMSTVCILYSDAEAYCVSNMEYYEECVVGRDSE